MSFRIILFLLALGGLSFGFFTWSTGPKEQKTGKEEIAFYNVENLFDTLDDPHKADNEFLPSGSLKWTASRYETKQAHLSRVVDELSKEGLVLMGLAEVENKQVVSELLQMPLLKDKKFNCIHAESADPRGIDVALIYTPAFKPLSHHLIPPCEENNCLESRGILAVKGLLRRDTVWVFVNHWPSRRTGESSKAKRMLMAQLLRHAIDSIGIKSPSCKIVAMGDFNDTPQDASIQCVVKQELLFNPFQKLNTATIGSIRYDKHWMIFDQIMLSSNWSEAEKSKGLHYVSNSASIFHPLYLHYKETLHDGPFRTYSGKKYNGGYSDHFPVYLIISR